jgi:hypothetical protein
MYDEIKMEAKCVDHSHQHGCVFLLFHSTSLQYKQKENMHQV